MSGRDLNFPRASEMVFGSKFWSIFDYKKYVFRKITKKYYFSVLEIWFTTYILCNKFELQTGHTEKNHTAFVKTYFFSQDPIQIQILGVVEREI